ncbi:hypothetical protein DPEC_G00149840 [Dallia pectoralis]|uniref:Uncharacterized protein n=1 Tax=Dallia pectoralis TaxID=75939 RepID=A0ACC2GJ71_DALPE|nr:hypothetical protein DPEC_G00149840 [Dallia pectoralis]
MADVESAKLCPEPECEQRLTYDLRPALTTVLAVLVSSEMQLRGRRKRRPCDVGTSQSQTSRGIPASRTEMTVVEVTEQETPVNNQI